MRQSLIRYWDENPANRRQPCRLGERMDTWRPIGGRIKFAPGSFMDQPLPKAEVVMMGHILHD